MQENTMKLFRLTRRYAQRFGLRSIFHIDRVPCGALSRYEVTFDNDEKDNMYGLVGLEMGGEKKEIRTLDELYKNPLSDQSRSIVCLPQFQYAVTKCGSAKKCIKLLIHKENEIILNFINEVMDLKLEMKNLLQLKGTDIGVISIRQDMVIIEDTGWSDISILLDGSKLLKELIRLDIIS